METMRPGLALAVLAVSFALSACGGGEPRTEPQTESAPGAAAPLAENVVRHGFVDMPHVLSDELEVFQGAIRTVIESVAGVHDEGTAVDEALARANFGDAATWSRAESLREPAIRRVYADLNGELGAP